MNFHPLGEHLPSCSNPTNCAEYAAVMEMTPTQYANYLNDSTARFAQLRAASTDPRRFRVSQEQDYSAPDWYARDTAKQRERDATPESRFWEQHKAERLRDLAEEHAEIYAHIAATPTPRLTAAELAEFEPPKPYALGIKQRQSKETK